MALAAKFASRRSQGRLRVLVDPLEQPILPLTIIPVLPQEDPARLEDRIDQFIQDMQPQTAAETELVTQAARLSWMIERADRLETAHLAHRVRKADLRAGKTSTRQFQQALELGRKLFYDARPVKNAGDDTPPPPWVDEPAVFLHGLEQTPDGCRWLLQRWLEIRNLVERKVDWSVADLFRFVRLLGKQGVEAVNDQALNVIFLAWDVIWPGLGKQFWKASRGRVSDRDPGLNAIMDYREIADRPRDKDQAWEILSAEVSQRIEQLSASLGDFARLAAADAADRAAMDLSPGLARHRRNRLAMGRELLRIMDILRKMATARNASKSKCGCSNGKALLPGACKLADDDKPLLAWPATRPAVHEEKASEKDSSSPEGERQTAATNGRPDGRGLSAGPLLAPAGEGGPCRGPEVLADPGGGACRGDGRPANGRGTSVT